jgi:hypothetical protein
VEVGWTYFSSLHRAGVLERVALRYTALDDRDGSVVVHAEEKRN